MKHTIRIEVRAYRDYVVEADTEDQALDLAYEQYNSESGWEDWCFGQAELECQE